MSAPMKFLGAAIIVWVGVRAVTMNAVPAPPPEQRLKETAAVSVGASESGFPPIEQLEAQAPPLPPSYYPYAYAYPDYPQYAAYPQARRPVPVYYYPVPAPQARPPARQVDYGPNGPDLPLKPYYQIGRAHV